MQRAPLAGTMSGKGGFRTALQFVSTSAAANAAELDERPAGVQSSLDRWVDVSWGWLPLLAKGQGREKLVAAVYGALCREGISVVGCSAASLATSLEEKEARPLAAWVRCCLDALESHGFAYRTYDPDNFLPTNASLELGGSLTHIAAIARFDDVRQGGASSGLEAHGAKRHREGEGADSEEPEAGPAARPSAPARRVRPLGAMNPNALRNCMVPMRGLECTGRLSRALDDWAWSRAVSHARKAQLHSGRRVAEVCNTEHSASGEYVLCGRTDGNLTVYKCASADARLEDSWDEALASGEALSVRDVKRSREINQVRWNPGNRNEIATSSKISGDIHMFDMRVCGTTGPKGRHTPTAMLTHRQGQASGGVLAFGYVPDSSLVVAGTVSAGVVVWDTRSPKGVKMTLGRKEDPHVCYTHVLRDGHTLLTGSTGGAVQLWDLRIARKRIHDLGKGDSDGVIMSAQIERQIPATNAMGRVVDGTTALAPDPLSRRAFALEPTRERELAFAAGDDCVGVFDLLSQRLSLIHFPSEAAVAGPCAPLLSRHRLAWLAPLRHQGTLAFSTTRGKMLLLDVAGHTARRARAWDGVEKIEAREWLGSSAVRTVSAHPSHPTLALSLADASLFSVRLGEGGGDALAHPTV